MTPDQLVQRNGDLVYSLVQAFRRRLRRRVMTSSPQGESFPSDLTANPIVALDGCISSRALSSGGNTSGHQASSPVCNLSWLVRRKASTGVAEGINIKAQI